MTSVLITVASSGIGAATALCLDRRGMEVFAAVKEEGDGAAALASASKRVKPVVFDVNDDRSIERAIAALHEQTPAGLDGLAQRGISGSAGDPACE